MSETDDTDELLLIPPDLFQIPSEFKSTEPYLDVVDNLISQVNNLDGRVRNIEDGIEDTTSSVVGDFREEIYNNKRQMYHHGRSFNSAENITVVDETIGQGNSSVKEGKVAFSSLPSTPNTDRSTLRSYSGRQGSYSNARNRYLNGNAKYQLPTPVAYNSIGRPNGTARVARNLSADFNMHATPGNKHSNLCTASPTNSCISRVVDQVIKEGAHVAKLTVVAVQEVEKRDVSSGGSTLSPTSGRSHESTDTAIYRYNAQIPRHINFEEDHTFRKARKLLEVNKHIVEPVQYDRTKLDDFYITSTDTNINTVSTSDAVQDLRNNCISPKTSSQPTCSNSSNPCCKCDNSKGQHNVLEAELIEDAFASGNLLGLSELFTSRQNLHNSSLDTQYVRNKLIEEKLRRLHCEQLIQDLQAKVLELQEKLSVAIEIDKNKTDSIEQFQKTWSQIATRVQQIITERNKFEKDLYDIQSRTVKDLHEASKKVVYYENEASKALNLATKHHEKIVQNDAKMIEILAELENCKSTISKYENNIQSEIKRNTELSKILGQKEIELNDSKKVIVDARKEIAQSKQTVEICQSDFTEMKSQYKDMELLLQNKQDVMKYLESQNRSMSQEIEKLKNVRCKYLEEELAKTKAAMERNKNELRQFYQSQLEVVVQEKLSQFQKQLDQAESNLQKEMKNRELTIAETAAQHIQQLSNKHRTEIRLLEAKQSEQLRLQQLKVQQMQLQLHEHQDRKQQIASQLHEMMEAQWREAVRIINTTKGVETFESGVAGESAMTRMERLHQELNDRSRTSLEEMLQLNVNNDDFKRNRNGPETFFYQTHGIDTVKVQDLQDGQSSSKATTVKGKQLIDADLQKCIDMLLNRPATIVAEMPRHKEKNSDINAHSSECCSGNELNNEGYPDQLRTANANSGSIQKSSKRPWK